MEFKNIFFLLMIGVIFLSISGISAMELNNDTLCTDDLCELESSDSLSNNELSIDNNLQENVEDGSFEDFSKIYVNQNQTDDGDGSFNNPYKNLDLACQKVNNENKNNVTIYIYNGAYEMGDNLNFNIENLNIFGVGNEIIIKNKFPASYSDMHQESFKLTSSSANLTISNIIFDDSDFKGMGFDYGYGYADYFVPFYGNANLVTFNNCSFNFDNTIGINSYNCQFINCRFNFSDKYSQKTLISNGLADMNDKFSESIFPTFEYCIFNMVVNSIGQIQLPCGIYINNSWFGKNALPKYVLNPSDVTKNPGGQIVSDWSIPVNRYAVFSVSENFLGNNQWEIIGKLTWNGTDDQDGMENFQPMTVELKSTTGEIASTATLVNGTFKTIYTSSASTHHIETKLDNEDNQELDFNTVNVTVIAPSIKYGDDQNITINFTQSINTNVSITVNNKTYIVKVNNSNSVTYKINNVNLTKGDYLVNVTLNDDVNHIYGSNSTILSVYKVSSYTFNPIVPSEATIGDEVTISVELPEDVTGNVIVYVNNNQTSKQASKNTIIDISDLIVVGNNNVTVFYEGNDKYENKTSEKQIIPIDKQDEYSFDVVVPSGVKVGDDANITIKLPGDVSGDALVYVGSQDPITVPVNGESTVVPVFGLVAGNNAVKVVFGDDKYAEKSVIRNITVEKVSDYAFDVVVPSGVKVGDDANITIKLPGDVSGDALVYVGSQDPITVPVNGESTVVPVFGLVAGNNTVKVVFGDNKYAEQTVIKNITVEKVPVEITNNTIVVNAPSDSATPTVSINIPDAEGTLTVIINNKTFTEKLENGTATVTINDVPTGKYNATVIYSGDDKFDKIITTANITVSEPKKQDTNTNTGGQTNKITKTATKIVAKKKTFKAKKKVKKYTITLKAGKKPVKKVWVTLKIKGKKLLKAKTNNKGKATFKIKKLTKKGKYTATIKFKGNKNYKASSKKVKITIKK